MAKHKYKANHICARTKGSLFYFNTEVGGTVENAMYLMGYGVHNFRLCFYKNLTGFEKRPIYIKVLDKHGFNIKITL